MRAVQTAVEGGTGEGVPSTAPDGERKRKRERETQVDKNAGGGG